MTVRDMVKGKDNGTCVKCGHEPEDETELRAHQIVPWSKGGSDQAENLTVLCESCSEFAPSHETVVVADGMYREAFEIYSGTVVPPLVDIASFGGMIRDEHGSDIRTLISSMVDAGDSAPRLSGSNWWSLLAALSDYEGYRKVVADDFPVESYLDRLSHL